MIRMCAVFVMFVGVLGFGQTVNKKTDLVPDEKTAVKIAGAVFVAQYGEDKVALSRPLHASTSGKDNWLVQFSVQGVPKETGGGPGLFINRHTGCLSLVPRMK